MLRAAGADAAAPREECTAPLPPLRRADAGGASSPADLVGMQLPPGVPFTLDAREVCLYALGVGAGRQPVFAGGAERRFVYEGDARFVALPTLAATFPFRGAAPGEDPVLGALAAAGLRFEPSALLHGEHELRLHAPLAAATRGAALRNSTVVEAVLDKRSGALVRLRTDTRLPDGALVATNTQAVFIRGLGGFSTRNAHSEPSAPPAQAPRRPPDAVWTERVDPSAALLYRLSGDTNPLHADPAAAARGGFDAPILHGACASHRRRNAAPERLWLRRAVHAGLRGARGAAAAVRGRRGARGACAGALLGRRVPGRHAGDVHVARRADAHRLPGAHAGARRQAGAVGRRAGAGAACEAVTWSRALDVLQATSGGGRCTRGDRSVLVLQPGLNVREATPMMRAGRVFTVAA